MKKRLYRCGDDKILCGVCSGVANYFDIDPTIVRFIWIIFCCIWGLGIIGYIAMAIIMPKENETKKKKKN